MSWRTMGAACAALCLAVIVQMDAVLAQSLFGDPYSNSYHRDYEMQMMLSRIIMMATSVTAGFALG